MTEKCSLAEFLQMFSCSVGGNEYCEVEIEPPLRGTGDVGVLLDDNGRGFGIKIHPGVTADGSKFLKDICHEVAHIRLHGDLMQNGEVAKMSPTERQQLEQEAKSMTELWLAYANDYNAAKYEYVSDQVHTTAAGKDMVRRLASIMDMPDEKQEEFDQRVFGIYRNNDELIAEMERHIKSRAIRDFENRQILMNS